MGPFDWGLCGEGHWVGIVSDLKDIRDTEWVSRLTRLTSYAPRVMRKLAYQGDGPAVVRYHKPHECGRCKERFRNPAALALHIKERHV